MPAHPPPRRGGLSPLGKKTNGGEGCKIPTGVKGPHHRVVVHEAVVLEVDEHTGPVCVANVDRHDDAVDVQQGTRELHAATTYTGHVTREGGNGASLGKGGDEVCYMQPFSSVNNVNHS